MPFFTHYGTGQRIGFLIVCVGFSLCFIGSIAPYWITAKTSIKADYFDLEDDITLFEVNVGVWYYCVDYRIDDKCISLYDTSDYKGPGREKDRFDWINVVRCGVVLNIILGFLSGLIACCRCMCCSGGRTICHGVLSFFAGGFGIVAFVIFYNHTKSLLNLPITEVDYAWAGALFALGSCMSIVGSFVLCCALPKENSYGMVVATVPTPGISVNVSNTNSNINQYNAGGSIQSFEPLPNAPGPQPPHHYNGFQPIAQIPPPPPPAYNHNQPGPMGYNYNHGGPVPSANHSYSK